MSSTPIVVITRRECFCSSHRLHSILLNDEENKDIFGKCNRPNGHGHNYAVEVSVKGPIDRRTGMIMNLTELKDIMNDCIIDTFDHRHMDTDIPIFEIIPSTSENMAVFIWDALALRIQEPAKLFEVKLVETEKNYVIYRGETEVDSNK